MIRQVVEWRLGPGAPGNPRNGLEIPGLGVISPAGADAAIDPLWDTWVDGSYTYLESDDFGAEFRGSQAAVGTGLDYALSDELTLAPKVGLSYSRSRDEAYTDNIGFFFPAQEIYTGVFNFGAALSYVIALDNDRSIEPSISVEGGWEFDLFGKPPLGVGVASNTDDKKVDVTITGGADIVLSDTVSLSLSSSVGGLTRKQYIETSGGAQVSVQF